MLPTTAIRTTATDLVIGRVAPLKHPLRQAFTFGGVGVGDNSRGMYSFVWLAEVLDKNTISLRRVTEVGSTTTPYPFEETLYEGADITEVSVAFDQNMRPVVAFVEGGETKVRRYDSLAGSYVVDTYNDAHSPRVALDGTAHTPLGETDIILSYIRNGVLYARIQRDNYLNEKTIQSGIGDGWFLRHAGMANNNTFQWVLFRRECYETETGEKHPPMS